MSQKQKIVCIRPPMSADANAEDESELLASTLALDTSLSDLAEQSPRLIALGWVIDGRAGSLCCQRQKEDPLKTIIPANYADQVYALAQAIHDLPEFLREMLADALPLVENRVTRPQDAPEGKR